MNKTEPSIGSLTSLFTGKKKAVIKPVSDILSGIHGLIGELKTAITAHEDKITERNAQIESLHGENDASRAEIAAAQNAHDNFTKLIGA